MAIRAIAAGGVLAMAFALAGPGLAQDNASTVWWAGFEESMFTLLPFGGWNVLGPSSAAALGMGETLLGAPDSSSTYLNPAALTRLRTPRIALGGRFLRNEYKTHMDTGVSYRYPPVPPETVNFERDLSLFDSAGAVIPLGSWALAFQYAGLQSYDFPGIRSRLGYYGLPDKVEQSGSLRGAGFAAAHRFNEGFSLGLSAMAVFGSVSRFQVNRPVYYILKEANARVDENTLLTAMERALAVYLPEAVIFETYDIGLSGISFTLGMTFKPGRDWLLGLAVRPPYQIRMEVDTKRVYNLGIPILPPDETGSGGYFSKQPMAVTLSALHAPAPGLVLAADLGYWGWSEYATDFSPNRHGHYLGRGIVKANFGASYAVKLPYRNLEALILRGGYVYDPQPYRFEEGFSRNFACFGLGLKIGPVDFDAAAKIAVIAPEVRRFRSSEIRLGLAFGF